MKKIWFPLLGVFFVYFQVSGQRCGTEGPDLQSPFHRWFNSIAAQTKINKVQALRVVPVVVHVIYRRENADHNISDAQIQSQISILNNDYRGRSGGIDSEIEFCLAGIRRIKSRDHHKVQKGTNDVQAKALSQAPPDQYLNIWVVNELKNEIGGIISGFAQLPDVLSLSPATDGVMIADEYFGNTGTAASNAPFHLGRTATHEVGHWLNLLHTHENPGCDNQLNCFITGDCCCDTPPQATRNTGCPFGLNSCSTDQPDLPDPIENFMTYSDDACMDRFTPCQIARMNLCLDSVRKVAWQVAGGDCPVFKLAAEAGMPDETTVEVFPHPIRAGSVLRIRLAGADRAAVSLMDAHGRSLETLLEPTQLQAGTHTFPLPSHLPAGRYFLRVQLGAEVTVKAVAVLR